VNYSRVCCRACGDCQRKNTSGRSPKYGARGGCMLVPTITSTFWSAAVAPHCPHKYVRCSIGHIHCGGTGWHLVRREIATPAAATATAPTAAAARTAVGAAANLAKLDAIALLGRLAFRARTAAARSSPPRGATPCVARSYYGGQSTACT
jgi:hypothetical protein